MITSQKLQEIGLPINDDWISLELTMELPKWCEPMVMSMDASGVKWTADWINNSKVLQNVTIDNSCYSNAIGALVARPSYEYYKFGHYATECQGQTKQTHVRDKKGIRNRKQRY